MSSAPTDDFKTMLRALAGLQDSVFDLGYDGFTDDGDIVVPREDVTDWFGPKRPKQLLKIKFDGKECDVLPLNKLMRRAFKQDPDAFTLQVDPYYRRYCQASEHVYHLVPLEFPHLDYHSKAVERERVRCAQEEAAAARRELHAARKQVRALQRALHCAEHGAKHGAVHGAEHGAEHGVVHGVVHGHVKRKAGAGNEPVCKRSGPCM